MTTRSMECGYFSLGDCCKVELVNNALTKQFVDQAFLNCDTPGFEGQPPPPCDVFDMVRDVCDQYPVNTAWTWPGFETGDTEALTPYAAWWYDPVRPLISGGVFGFVGVSLDIGSADQFTGDSRNALRNRPRRIGRGVRAGVLRLAIIANGRDSQAYAVEALRTRLTQGQQDCPCKLDSIEAYRSCCARDDTSGKRLAQDVGGFFVEVDDPQPSAAAAACVCMVTVTFEIGDPLLYATDDTIECAPTIGDCVCYEPCAVPQEEVTITTYTERQTRTVKLINDPNTGERTVCGVDFDLADYDPAFIYEVGAVAAVAQTAPTATTETCKPYRVRLNVDENGDTQWRPVNPERWAANTEDGEIFPCDCEIYAADITYPNDNYQPECTDCSGSARACASLHGIVLDAAGYIDIAASGIDLTLSGAENAQASKQIGSPIVSTAPASGIDRLIAYFGCTGATINSPDGGGQDLNDNGIDQNAVACTGVGGVTQSYIEIVGNPGPGASSSPGLVKPSGSTPGFSTQCNARISEDVPGWSVAVPPEGATSLCGAVDGDHCLEFLTTALAQPNDQTEECYTIDLNGDSSGGSWTHDGWDFARDGLPPNYASIVINNCYEPTTTTVSTETAADLCDPYTPAEACVTLSIADGAGTWDPSGGWTVGTAWPYSLPASQFVVCDQDTDPIASTSTEYQPKQVAAIVCDPPCDDTPTIVPRKAVKSCWESLCPPLEERRAVCEFTNLPTVQQLVGAVTIANNSDQALERVEVLWFSPRQTPAISPTTDWGLYRCADPLAVSRILEIPAGGSFCVSGEGALGSAELTCGLQTVNGVRWLDAASGLQSARFCGYSTLYAVVRFACCGAGDALEPGLTITASLTPVEAT